MDGFSTAEIKVLNQYAILSPSGRKQLESYLDYLTVQQCRSELSAQLLNNNWLHNHLLGLDRLSETSEDYCHEVLERVDKLKVYCQGIYEQLFNKYALVLNDFSVLDGVLDWILIGLKQIRDAARAQNPQRTQLEIMDLLETHRALTQSKVKTKVLTIEKHLMNYC